MAKKGFVVTPWEVRGEIDYDKLIKQFGISPIDENLLARIKKHTKELHFMLRRKIFFAHRDLDWLLDEYEKGNEFCLYTGRGPSGHTHLGHLIPWIFTKWLQDKFGAKLYFQITDDEKFLFKRELELEDTKRFSYENILDIIAVGFDPKKTFIFLDTEYCKTLYPQAVRVAKHITFSTAKAVFGFENESNVGQIFFTSMQAVPAFLESVKRRKNAPCLIPLGVDQDPHFRVARDVMPKLGYYKPAIIHSKLLPSLLGPGAKMSASDPRSTIYTTDSEEVAKKKIMNAFTGQQPTAELQRRLGGNPEICSVCQYYYFLFEEDDKRVEEIFEAERNGSLLAGEHKADLAERVVKFLKEHQKKREKAKGQIEKFILRD
jgi:tryptophanyl-tRNA synthetase